jgi:hypothetical protein
LVRIIVFFRSIPTCCCCCVEVFRSLLWATTRAKEYVCPETTSALAPLVLAPIVDSIHDQSTPIELEEAKRRNGFMIQLVENFVGFTNHRPQLLGDGQPRKITRQLYHKCVSGTMRTVRICWSPQFNLIDTSSGGEKPPGEYVHNVRAFELLFPKPILRRTMKQTVSQIREEWYGNHWDVSVGHTDRKGGVDCSKHFGTRLDFAATKFVPLCDGISGTIGALVVDRDYVEDAVAFPIDALVVDLSKLDDDLIDEEGIIP